MNNGQKWSKSVDYILTTFKTVKSSQNISFLVALTVIDFSNFKMYNKLTKIVKTW